MIVKYRWRRDKKLNKYSLWEGWFLFGVIPLYIRQTTQWLRGG